MRNATVIPADALADVLVHLREFGFQVLQQAVEKLWNSPLLLSQTTLEYVQTTAEGRRPKDTQQVDQTAS